MVCPECGDEVAIAQTMMMHAEEKAADAERVLGGALREDRTALEAARYALVTAHRLWATDTPQSPQLFQLDLSSEIAAIDRALGVTA